MLTTFKCGTVNAFNRVPLLTIMTILFVEIVIFEIFLSSGKQLKNHIIQYTVKFVAFVLTISNLVQYETCENLNRDVRSYCQALCPFLCLCVQKFKKMDTD